MGSVINIKGVLISFMRYGCVSHCLFTLFTGSHWLGALFNLLFPDCESEDHGLVQLEESDEDDEYEVSARTLSPFRTPSPIRTLSTLWDVSPLRTELPWRITCLLSPLWNPRPMRTPSPLMNLSPLWSHSPYRTPFPVRVTLHLEETFEETLKNPTLRNSLL